MTALLLVASLYDPRYLLLLGDNLDLLLIYPVILVTGLMVRLMFYVRNLPRRRVVRASWLPVLQRILKTREFWRYYFAPAALIFTVYIVFPGLKQMIPQIRPYYADMWLAAADEVFHGGHRVHIYLLPYLDPWVMLVLDRVYASFFLVSLCFFIYMGRRGANPELRYLFMTSFMLAWPLFGIGFAVFFSSVGPSFHELVPLGVKYPRLMGNIQAAQEYLQNFGLSLYSPKIQAYLLSLYHNHTIGFGGGISAMPSLHIAIPTLMMMAGWKSSRWLGVLTTLYLILTAGAAISLGWHYAVDVYVGIFLSFFLWALLFHGGVALRKKKVIKSAIKQAT